MEPVRRELRPLESPFVHRASDLLLPGRTRPVEPDFVTGLESLDRLLAGGLSRGRLVELVGGPSGGRFSIVTALLATATRQGDTVALVDLGDHLSPLELDRRGGDLRHLLWVRPRDRRELLAAAEALVTGGFPLVVLDLGLPPVPGGRGQETTWIRLARTAVRHRTALLLSAPYRTSGVAAHAVVRLRNRTADWKGSTRLLQGTTASCRLEKGAVVRNGEWKMENGKFPEGSLRFAGGEESSLRFATEGSLRFTGEEDGSLRTAREEEKDLGEGGRWRRSSA